MAFRSENELLTHAKNLHGKTISDLLNGEPFDNGKGAIGNIIERKGFGFPNNNIPGPDFENLGIELKVLPLKLNSKGELIVKERTKVCSINYKELIKENWSTSHARGKLIKVLFVFYQYDKTEPINSRIKSTYLYHLEKHSEPILKEDWERTHQRVCDGYAHVLSESENLYLAASRSGAGKLEEKYWPDQPNTIFSAKARQRAFSLKPSYTRALWHELNKKPLEEISSKYKYNSYKELENTILSKLNAWEGRTLYEFMKINKIEIGKGKNANATILRTALGFKKGVTQLKEIVQLGLIVKTIPCDPNKLYPYEAMSFPYQELADIRDEERFDESEFYTYLQGFLFIPLIRETREEKSPNKITFGRSFIWRPSHNELVKIQLEWEKNQETIRSGINVIKQKWTNAKGYRLTNNLIKESETEYIHMRPHARDSNDIDKSIKGLKISKQCFWFNKSFIQKKLINHNS